ncbi:DUF2782 domain-containing protein [Chitiniphilus purpureus]|uniref:DUF2782 domain-containing protein n=1 Tax=Chitiniphilus purpureus TaxID=2981137 RepID=A0ABY6DNS0_9NEIS|nr:DUF2782 domain-containing protein [Chitiniphilus sp. CD1]UXY16029.1 DUF2782 domain-containing protein [Chitiniphilus sp. CD1]
MRTPYAMRLAVCQIALIAAVIAPFTLADDVPPPLPAEDSEGVAAEEPEVRIVEKGDATVAEYRIHGKLYMMKVMPRIGPAYYLIDREGNGRFERDDTGGPDLAVPRWVLFSW